MNRDGDGLLLEKQKRWSGAEKQSEALSELTLERKKKLKNFLWMPWG